MVKIELTTKDAELFKQFCRHYDTFGLLMSRGVFDVKNGSVVLDFDKNSELQTIRFTGFMYSKRHEDKKFFEPTAFYNL